jgi:hypothetical protein
VVRGRVVTKLGMGLMGVRVSTTASREGFTLTRDDGWFDLMVRFDKNDDISWCNNPQYPS